MLKAIAADKRRIVDVIFSFTHKITSVLWKDHHNLGCYKPQTNVKPLLQSSALTLDITSVFGNRYLSVRMNLGEIASNVKVFAKLSCNFVENKPLL